ncbi:LOB domain-containing protein 25-like [Ananas comosus]|uniref:LOB domain-containing protein 25-like n=1 Tax=Ananas comosus TaxID=4615 RepID=A0A6P5EHI1_ANACO|nr:LOB domain-containing protein 25-like [Ananas comosus]XP_020082803.1 LOB domain-containing protein 25-like [Ananas comosus]XP_020097724.1 LOB domain-containing protein 25-like [Ananas comosus]XP_020097726.1 LOB domain-containing protein 25-like [Ananas comosus]XP_020097727.1 LOB domain-containing protein 25-like [Ananas comosus]XP_020104942.1 LOB domain-containing protein 25-like [Ananas comosus]XP_020104943.1 LOB domain-containing protein 25-like [Ananas comosus]XP_020104944.1 LOB domain
MSSSSSSSSSTSNSPCAACKFLRRKCMPGCIFAPYFPPEEPQKFINVHKVFGASNVTKLLNELLPHQREDAVNSLAYEAEARVKDPVYGCVGAISVLQRQVQRLQKELEIAHADLLRYACGEIPTGHLQQPQSAQRLGSLYQRSGEYGRRVGNGGGVGGPLFNQGYGVVASHVPNYPATATATTTPWCTSANPSGEGSISSGDHMDQSEGGESSM